MRNSKVLGILNMQEERPRQAGPHGAAGQRYEVYVLGEGPGSGMAGVSGWIHWLMAKKAPPIPLELKGHDAQGTKCPVVEVWSFPGG